jgi:YHS domain-containing protein
MKTTLILAAIVSLCSGALAGPNPPAKAPVKIKCAVMNGNDVIVAAATKNHMYADYKGNRYFFCCGGCPQAFKADPAKYAKAPHIKIPKTK